MPRLRKPQPSRRLGTVGDAVISECLAAVPPGEEATPVTRADLDEICALVVA